MGDGIVSSKTQKQTSAVLSSVETEYMARQVPFYRLRKPVRCSLAISESNLALEQCSSFSTYACHLTLKRLRDHCRFWVEILEMTVYLDRMFDEAGGSLCTYD